MNSSFESQAEGTSDVGVTSGLVCAHHHLYSTLARGMPAPPSTPHNFQEILELVWWRLDSALDMEMIKWSAMLGALEALASGVTTVADTTYTGETLSATAEAGLRGSGGSHHSYKRSSIHVRDFRRFKMTAL